MVSCNTLVAVTVVSGFPKPGYTGYNIDNILKVWSGFGQMYRLHRVLSAGPDWGRCLLRGTARGRVV